jgi:cytochrome b561
MGDYSGDMATQSTESAMDGHARAHRAAPAYTRTAVALHWLAALLIACNLALGVTMINLALSPFTLRLYGWHKWIGITVFLTAATRVAWRWAHPPPPAVAMPLWQRRAAAGTHAALYALMLAIPLSGWVYSSSTGVSVVYLGLFPLPDLVGKDKALAAGLKAVHATLNFTLFALVCLHAGAALRHHIVDRDGVLRRMLPFLRRD